MHGATIKIVVVIFSGGGVCLSACLLTIGQFLSPVKLRNGVLRLTAVS